jgi:very-short-patch-repair endonuclease
MVFDRDTLQKRSLVWNGKHLPYNPDNIAKARQLRKNMTPQESKLWEGFLRRHSLRFIRQRAVDHYILDFYCARYRVAIEIDGKQHAEEAGIEYDRSRTEILAIYRILVLRFTNTEIDLEFNAVCRKIEAAIATLI